MIRSLACDVEIFPNVFSVTFVDLKSYLDTFKDCVNDKRNPIPLTECLSVKEIKERLETVKKKIFYITDSDDSQLLDLVAYINQQEACYVTKEDATGNTIQEPCRTDMFGFNSLGYDDNMIKAFMMTFNRHNNIRELILYLYKTSKLLIEAQKDKERYYGDKSLETIRNYKLPWCTIDVQQVFGLHSAGVNIDKNGNRNKYGKRLKQTAINLKWHEILDFVLPEMDKEEAKYYRRQDHYKGMPLEQLKQLITNDFDRYILPQYVEPMLHYNCNDVYLVCEMVRQNPNEIKLRYSISNAFKINAYSSARANIADKLTTKFYSNMSGLSPKQFKDLRTQRTRMSFNKVIFPHIKFKTPQLQQVLEEMKQVYVYRTDKDAFTKKITFYGTTYTLACGGIHTQDNPMVLKSNDNYEYRHFDYNSYYPSIIVSYDIAPEHLNRKIFVNMVKYFKDTRVKAKHTPDSEGYVIAGVPNAIAAEALKIVINSIYGKFGSELFFLYDRMAQLRVTINGQLMTMTLVEELELNGIHVISANTDGIVIKMPRDKESVFDDIVARWNETNKMGADSENYKSLFIRDVNNYFAIWTNDKVDYKGALDPLQYRKNLTKGYNAPIIAKAVYEYLVNNIPVMDTLKNHNDILDFCKTQLVGKQFNVVYTEIKKGSVTDTYSQRDFRYYVSKKGVLLQKEHEVTKHREKLASGLPVTLINSLDDKPIEERNIDYKYYYEEAYKIINPILLGIGNNAKKGKVTIKKYSQMYNTLFDYDD